MFKDTGDTSVVGHQVFINQQVTTLNFKNSALGIEEKACLNNKSLLEVKGCSSITYYGTSAFEGCTKMHKFNTNDDDPDNCIRYETAGNAVVNYLFFDCTSINRVIVNENFWNVFDAKPLNIGSSSFKTNGNYPNNILVANSTKGRQFLLDAKEGAPEVVNLTACAEVAPYSCQGITSIRKVYLDCYKTYDDFFKWKSDVVLGAFAFNSCSKLELFACESLDKNSGNGALGQTGTDLENDKKMIVCPGYDNADLSKFVAFFQSEKNNWRGPYNFRYLDGKNTSWESNTYYVVSYAYGYSSIDNIDLPANCVVDFRGQKLKVNKSFNATGDLSLVDSSIDHSTYITYYDWPTRTNVECGGLAENSKGLQMTSGTLYLYDGYFRLLYRSTNGSVINLKNSSFYMYDGYFDGNAADNHDGAIYYNSTTNWLHFNIYKGYFDSNCAVNGHGGAICIEKSSYVSNSVDYFYVQNTHFKWNNAYKGGHGGAIYLCFTGDTNVWSELSSMPTITKCNFDRNVSDFHEGGAIYLWSNLYSVFTNNTFHGNTAGSWGAAISVRSLPSKLEIKSCTFESNRLTNASASHGTVSDLYKGGGGIDRGYMYIKYWTFKGNTDKSGTLMTACAWKNEQTSFDNSTTDDASPYDGIYKINSL